MSFKSDFSIHNTVFFEIFVNRFLKLQKKKKEKSSGDVVLYNLFAAAGPARVQTL